MNHNSVFITTALLPLFVLMAGCAPMHDDRQSLSQQTPAANVDTTLPAALKMAGRTASGGGHITTHNLMR